jgi:hypothetical protein
MASPVHILKNSFAGGEVSPQLHVRNDLAKYDSWAKTLKNVFVHKDGTASNRPGTHYMATAKHDNKKCRVRKFVFSTIQAYELEIGEYYVRFFTVGPTAGQIVHSASTVSSWVSGTVYYYNRAIGVNDYVKSGGLIYRCLVSHTASAAFATDLNLGRWIQSNILEVPTPYAEDDLEFLKFTQSADVLFVTHPEFTPRMLSRLGSTNWTFTNYPFTGGPFQLPNSDNSLLIKASGTSGLGITLTASARTWVAAKAYEIGTYTASGSTVYKCLVKHTSSPLFATDLGYKYWVASSLSVFDAGQAPNTATGNAGSLFQLKHYVEGGSANKVVNNHDISGVSANVKCGGTWRVVTHGTWAGEFVVQKSTNNGDSWTDLRKFTGTSDFNVDTYGVEDMSDNAEPFLVRSSILEITDGKITVDISTDPFYQIGIAQITAYSSGSVVTADVKRGIAYGNTSAWVTAHSYSEGDYVIQSTLYYKCTKAHTSAVAFSTDLTAKRWVLSVDPGPTTDWTEGSWGGYYNSGTSTFLGNGWPAVIEFLPQDRLIFGNTYTEPQTFWMTKTGNYYDFSRSSPLVATDGITVNLPSREVNGINNLIPLTTLLALTSSSEWSIGDPGTILTPTSIEQRVNGYEGSNGVDAALIGNRAVYVQSMGAVIRDVGYELQSYSFTGSDLGVLANHLFFNKKIVSMDYQRSPDRLVWCVRDDGIILSMTYLREQDVLAWCWSDTNSGTDTFECVSVVPAVDYDETWFVVKRGTARYIERMARRFASTAPEDQFFMDCGISYNGVPATIITGLTHLIGKTVAILADGEVKKQQVVSATGTITLDVAASVVHVGLPYVSDIETLNINQDLKDGTSQGRRIKISQFVLGLYKSRGGWIGPTFDDLYELRDNFITKYGTAVDLFTGEVKDTMGGGYEDGGKFCVRQIDPLPFTLRYIAAHVTVGGTTGV